MLELFTEALGREQRRSKEKGFLGSRPFVSTYVYFLCDEASGQIKIGFTWNIRQRLEGIRKRRPSAQVLAYGRGDRRLERSLHLHFKHHALGHEWFHPGADLVEFIATLPSQWVESRA